MQDSIGEVHRCIANLKISDCRVLLWRRSDNLCYVLLLGGQPEKGEGVVCKVKAIIQARFQAHTLVSLSTVYHF